MKWGYCGFVVNICDNLSSKVQMFQNVAFSFIIKGFRIIVFIFSTDMSSGLLQVFVDSIKDVVRSSVKVSEFDKHLQKVGGHIDRNAVEITIKMKIIVRKPLMIKTIKPHLRNTNAVFSFFQPLGSRLLRQEK